LEVKKEAERAAPCWFVCPSGSRIGVLLATAICCPSDMPSRSNPGGQLPAVLAAGRAAHVRGATARLRTNLFSLKDQHRKITNGNECRKLHERGRAAHACLHITYHKSSYRINPISF